MMRWSCWLAAVICCCSLFVLAKSNEPAAKNLPKESPGVESVLAEYADEVGYARTWLEGHNDVTSIVEILNSLKRPDPGKTERSFNRALRTFFPKSRRMPELEPGATEKMARFFDFYHLRGKIEVRVFSLGFPMAFNTGQIVGVSNQLIEGWPEEELLGIVAHEIGHIIAQTQDRLMYDVPPTGKAYQRAEEIKADWVAMMMFSSAGLDPRNVMKGLEQIVPRSQFNRAGPLHPPMAVRLVLMREWLTLPRQRLRLRDALLQISSPTNKAMVIGQ